MLLGHLTSDAFLRIDDDYTSDLCANESRSSISFLNMVVVVLFFCLLCCCRCSYSNGDAFCVVLSLNQGVVKKSVL